MDNVAVKYQLNLTGSESSTWDSIADALVAADKQAGLEILHGPVGNARGMMDHGISLYAHDGRVLGSIRVKLVDLGAQ